MNTESPTGDDSNSEPDRAVDLVREALRGLRFGTISLIVQDGVVVQIDRTEKRRVARANSAKSKSPRPIPEEDRE